MTTLEPTTWLSPGQRVISDADGDRGVIEGPALYDASRVWVRWSSGASSMAPIAKLRHDVETLAQEEHAPVARIQIQRLRAALQEFVDFQIGDYDRMANRARAYCAIRRRAVTLLQELQHVK